MKSAAWPVTTSQMGFEEAEKGEEMQRTTRSSRGVLRPALLLLFKKEVPRRGKTGEPCQLGATCRPLHRERLAWPLETRRDENAK